MTLAELRNDPVLSTDAKADLEYIEQLASQTNTDIANWDLNEILFGVKHGDRRAINKAFFAKANSLTLVPAEVELPANVKEHLEKRATSWKRNQVEELNQNLRYYREELSERIRRVATKLTDIHRINSELDAIQGAPVDFETPIKKIFNNKFWQFDGFYGIGSNAELRFKTVNDCIMTEVIREAGVSRRVNLGKFYAVFSITSSRIRVYAAGENTFVGQYYHPYVYVDGEICWGNASGLAADHIADHKWDKAMELLSGLLTNYSSDTTPWMRLSEFERVILARTNPEPTSQVNLRGFHQQEPENDDNEDRFYCGACDQYYDSPCDEHWCSICETYEAPDCGCCHECQTSSDNCDCCSECGEPYQRCNRCRECDNHDGDHSDNCSANEQEEDDDET